MTVDFIGVNDSVTEEAVQLHVCVGLSVAIERSISIQLLTSNGSASGLHY